MSPAGSPGDGAAVALVLGASRGLGLRVSEELIGRGITVHGCARDADELARAADLARWSGSGAFVPHVCDVRDADAVHALVEEVLAQEGRIDVAIHVAGVIQVGPVESLTRGHFEEAIDTMLWGPIHCALAVLPAMRARGFGRIGIITSVGGVASVPHLVPYSAAKFGAVGLGEGLYADLAGSGVTVTTVAPGLMRTGGHLAARFVGSPDADYPWFALGASLPVVSMPVDRAARRAVDGILAGRPVVDLGLTTRAARLAKGLAPATTVRVLGAAGRLLPTGPKRGPDVLDRSAPADPGRVVRRRSTSWLLESLTRLGTRAAERTNETL